ncbi:MAG: extracellular solute-binding protein [Clostridiales bacterium]|nr:extracellular solute-binding protein [Clostridiales bacterium]
MKSRFAIKKVLCVALSAFMLTGVFSGCSKSNNSNSKSTSKGPVVLNIPDYRTGQNVGAKFFLPQVDRFNKKYEGKYKINIEEVPQDSYNDKIKQLAQQDKLPPIVNGADTQWFQDYIIKNNKFYDLSSWLNSKPNLKNVVLKDSLDYDTVDGKVVCLPQVVSRPIGLYYNNTMYKPSKAIRDMSVDEFYSSLGDNKLALMTGENAWTTQLLFSAIIANQPGGKDILTNGVKTKITDYTGDVFVKSAEILQKFFKNNAAPNSVGAVYADAANTFMSKKASMIFNGSWMVGDLSKGAEGKWSNGFTGDQVTSDIYPGNVALANNMGYWYWIPANTPKNQVEAALAFFEFATSQAEVESWILAEGGVAPNMKMSDSFLTKQKDNRLLNELATSITKDTILCPSFDDAIPNSVQAPAFGKLLPKLIDGSLSSADFCKQLTAEAQATK